MRKKNLMKNVGVNGIRTWKRSIFNNNSPKDNFEIAKVEDGYYKVRYA